MTDTSDLVEWLERRGNKMSYGGRLVEAATALTAKDKEIDTKDQAIADMARIIYELKERVKELEK